MIFCAATNNPGKLRELRRILQRMGHEVKSPQDLGIVLDPAETGDSFAANAAQKAQAYMAECGLPVVADDSGLCVRALGGAPGIYSARYAGRHGDDAANNKKLLEALSGVPWQDRDARFVSAVCLLLVDGRQQIVTGECAGRIGFSPQGANGFGYDPLFIPDRIGLPGGATVPNESHRSYAELTDVQKDAISHRGRALANLAAQLESFLRET